MFLVSDVLAAVAPERQPYYVLWFSPYRFGEFLLGVCLAVALRRGWLPQIRLAVPAVCCVAAYLVATWASTVTNVSNQLMLLPFALLIVAAAQYDLRGGRSSRPIVLLGDASFACTWCTGRWSGDRAGHG
jgi:peptidoglycan/LPS O-acetylase OafA/YrhL